MEDRVEIKPHIIIPHYVYSSKMGCVGQKFCGLIFGLSSKYGYCSAKNEYFATFFGMSEEAVRKQISRLLKEGFIKNIGSKSHRKLILGYIEKDTQAELDKNGQNVTTETKNGQDVTTKGQNVSYLPIIYNKYILKSKSKLETGQMSDKEILEALFDYFWSGYPRREKKKQTKTSFFRLGKSDLEKLLQILPQITERYASTQKQFIPLPTSFINGELWEDEYFLSQKIAKEGAELSEDAEEMKACVQRFVSLSEGEEIELISEDFAVLQLLGMDVNDAIDEIQLYSVEKFYARVTSVWNDAVRDVA